MIRRLIAAAVLWISGAAVVCAADAPAREANRPDVASALDQQDLLLFAPLRPIVVRLHIAVDRIPFRQLWQERIERAFTEADTDHDGKLTGDEAKRLLTTLVPSAADAQVEGAESGANHAGGHHRALPPLRTGAGGTRGARR